MFTRRKQIGKEGLLRGRLLRAEGLESRCMLAGVVGVTLNGDTLEFRGDNQANEIEVRQIDDPWIHRFQVIGIGTDLDKDNNGSTDALAGEALTFDGVNNFDVQLMRNDDTFSFLEHTGGTLRSELDGNVEIVNDVGTNTNSIGSDPGAGVLIKGALTITRTDQDNIFSTTNTNLYNAEVDGTVEITTGRTTRTNNGGDSTTVITDCDFGSTFAFQAREGMDVFDLQDSNIGGDTTIYTTETTNYDDAGESVIRFTASGGETNKVEGSLEIVTANDFNGEDFVSFNSTETESAVTIDTHDGAAQVLVQNESNLGTDLNSGPQDLTVTYDESNASQQKQFELNDSSVQWNAYVSTSEAGRLKVTVDDSTVGENTIGELYVTGDSGDDQVTLTDSTIGSIWSTGFYADLDGGNNSIDIRRCDMSDAHVTTGGGFDTLNMMDNWISNFSFYSTGGDDSLSIVNSKDHDHKLMDFLYTGLGGGDDQVFLENVIAKDTSIELEDGEDTLSLEAVSLLGPFTLDGGGSDDDTFRGDQDAINDYALVALNFEHQELIEPDP